MRAFLKNAVLTMVVFSVGACGEARPDATITFNVVTDEGTPVPDAEVVAIVFDHWEPGTSFGTDVEKEFTGRTDRNGKATIALDTSRGEVKYRASAEAYYKTTGLSYRLREVRNGRWEPWNATVLMVLKPKINPIPMYARRIGFGGQFQITKLEEDVGFDLVVSDWVKPFGKGQTNDLVFKLSAKESDGAALTLKFSNAGDGIQSVDSQALGGSILKLPRVAPDTGYDPTLEMKFVASSPTSKGRAATDGYFFRIRTRLDEKGRVVSAIYGKIDDQIQFWTNGSLRFTYYVNGTANDRNMEYDPEKNLLSGLASYERPTVP